MQKAITKDTSGVDSFQYKRSLLIFKSKIGLILRANMNAGETVPRCCECPSTHCVDVLIDVNLCLRQSFPQVVIVRVRHLEEVLPPSS